MSQKRAKQIRRTMRREVRHAIGDGIGVLWEAYARKRWPVRLRLAWRMLRGRGVDGKRLGKETA